MNKKVPLGKNALDCSIIEFFETILKVTTLSHTQKVTLKAIRGENLDNKKFLAKEHILQDRDFANEVELFKFLTGKTEYIPTNYSDASLCFGRRSGKCHDASTEILTPNGPVRIDQIKVGDLIYGYNSDGSITITPVLRVYDNGIKEVFELNHGNKTLAASTENHKWLASIRIPKRSGGSYYKVSEKQIKDFSNRDQFVERRFVKIPCGDINEPHAYAIGALLGDGCSRQGSSSRIDISSAINEIPNKIATILNAERVSKNSNKNYTWSIFKSNIHCNHYEKWCKGRYAHEKTIDLEIIKTWDRKSCLELMAGLLDTDGSVYCVNNRLQIQFGCQAKDVVEVFNYLFYKLFQYKMTLHEDHREKYKNGSIWYVRCSSNLYTKMAIYELNDHLVHHSRKWKPKYADLPEQRSDERIGVVIGESYKAKTYDLEIGNDTHLYLLANEGLITHNSTTIGAGLALYYATQFDYEQFLGTNPHATIPIVSPTKEQAGEVYQAIKMFCLRSPYIFQKFLDGDANNFEAEYSEDDIGAKAKMTGGLIKLNNQVIIKVMAADISKIRGMAVPFAILDEVCFFGVEGNDTKNTDKAISEALEPALSQFQVIEGMALVLKISSPNGQAGLMFEDYENRKDSDVLHVQAPSWYANPTVPLGYLEKQRKKGAAFYNREYGAQYVASEQSYLDPSLIDECILRGIEDIDPIVGYRYVAAMDYATKDDYWTLAIEFS